MSSPQIFGRNRDSLTVDIQEELHELFTEHPKATVNDAGKPVIPGAALPDILSQFTHNHDSLELLDKGGQDALIGFVAANPQIEVTPEVLMNFIVQLAGMTPSSLPGSPPAEDDTTPQRGRDTERTEYEYYNRSRSSSRDSIGTSVYRPSSQSRPPSRGPPVPPKTPMKDSPFDTTKRQRSQPLQQAAPSSWTRRPPPTRRRSDAGMQGRASSDTESSISSPPVAYSRSQGSTGRARAPSNPVSPDPYSAQDSGRFSPSPISIGSPQGGSYSRPHSRTQSLPQGQFASLDALVTGHRHGSVSPDEDHDYYDRVGNTGLMSPPPSDLDLSDASFHDRLVNSIPMPRNDSDSDSDGEDDDDPTLGLVHERLPTSSTISLDISERLEALQRANHDLKKKLRDNTEAMEKRISGQEAEILRLEQEIEEKRSELAVAKRAEKELRAKDRNNQSQIATLESNIQQLSKSLENSRQAYHNLNAQYAEQCAESQRYRDDLVKRDEMVAQLQLQNNLHGDELKKWEEEQSLWMARIKQMEDSLVTAQHTQASLDEQKQENMMLKETIDRLRFEMDEMRTSATSGLANSGSASAKATISRSLGAELLSKMNDGMWNEEANTSHEEPEHEEEVEEVEGSEDEDVIQTIITRTKRKVASRAKKIDTVQIEEVKEYSDAAIQHDLATRTFCVQTDPQPRPVVSSFSIQTEDAPSATISTQTDPEPTPVPVATAEMQIQTDDPEPEASGSGSPHAEEDDENLASSSSTLLPPTPKAQLEHHLHDLPPSYHQVAGQDQDELAIRVANETLKKWHNGLKLPFQPVAGGVSEDAVEDWKALKEELGVGCSAIDRLVEESSRTGLPRPGNSKERRRSRFYNIYNTYVYGDKESGSGSLFSSGQMFVFCVGASAAVAFLVGSAMNPQYSVPGGATYYDRAAWSSFNSIQAVGEGFPGDAYGSTAFWGLLGRVGGGAARRLQGWPT